MAQPFQSQVEAAYEKREKTLKTCLNLHVKSQRLEQYLFLILFTLLFASLYNSLMNSENYASKSAGLPEVHPDGKLTATECLVGIFLSYLLIWNKRYEKVDYANSLASQSFLTLSKVGVILIIIVYYIQFSGALLYNPECQENHQDLCTLKTNFGVMSFFTIILTYKSLGLFYLFNLCTEIYAAYAYFKPISRPSSTN